MQKFIAFLDFMDSSILSSVAAFGAGVFQGVYTYLTEWEHHTYLGSGATPHTDQYIRVPMSHL